MIWLDIKAIKSIKKTLVKKKKKKKKKKETF